MTNRQQWMVVGVIVVLAAGGVAIGVRTLGDELVQVTAGSRAPNFTAVTLDSAPQLRTLADYRGQVTVLNVWATFCAPCRVEMPSMERLYAEYRPKGLRMVAVTVDAPGMENAIRAFTEDLGLTFDILYDSRGAIQRDYMTTGVPETFVIGKDGIVRFKYISAKEWDSPEVKALIDQLLAET
jgi:peroxiredoxin